MRLTQEGNRCPLRLLLAIGTYMVGLYMMSINSEGYNILQLQAPSQTNVLLIMVSYTTGCLLVCMVLFSNSGDKTGPDDPEYNTPMITIEALQILVA